MELPRWKWKLFHCVRLFVTHGLYSPWESPGQNTGAGKPFPSPGDLPNPGSIPGLPHCRLFLYQLSQKGSKRILEWVAYLFSSGSSQPRNQIGVSCIAVRFFTNWAIRESLEVMVEYKIRLGLRLRPGSHKMHFKEVLWHDLPSGSQILMHITITWKACLRTYRFLVFTSDFLN